MSNPVSCRICDVQLMNEPESACKGCPFYKTRPQVNIPICIDGQNGGCKKRALFVLSYTISNGHGHFIAHNDPFCRLHAQAHLAHLRDYLGLKVKVLEFGNEKEKVLFT